MKNIFITLNTVSRLHWFRTACENRRITLSKNNNDIIYIFINDRIKKEYLEAYHIVILSCLIEELKKKRYKISIKASNDLNKFLLSDVNIREYWGEKHYSHVESPDINRFNLWRINEKDKDSYAISVNNYFSKLFPDKDVSFITTALNELYYNVFDHANANGNAFSYIYHDEHKRRIYVAVCDFGEGVAKTLRRKYPEYDNDETALRESIKIGVSSKTMKHNRGLGLDNICSSLERGDSFRMVSNNAILYIFDNDIKTFNLNDLRFNGTLIYFDFCTDNFGDAEVLDSFSL